MNESAALDIEQLRQWIGRRESVTDSLTPRLACELNASLGNGDDVPEPGAPAPAGLHWCLAHPVVSAARICVDGHPQRGGFLPPVPLPRRMWAGSKLTFPGELRVGDIVQRNSTIADISVKHGRSGTLCFVAVDHEISSPRGLAILERQDIVYRDIAPPPPPGVPAEPEIIPKTIREVAMKADPVLLFRYSALTFNGHRIHYDREYAMNEELYPGLVVHGPLQATLLLGFAAEILGRHPEYFAFRGVAPLFDFDSFTLGAAETEDGLRLWIRNQSGAFTVQAEAK